MTQSPVVRIELASLFAEFKHEESDSFSHVLPVQQLVTDLFTENEYSLFQRYSLLSLSRNYLCGHESSLLS